MTGAELLQPSRATDAKMYVLIGANRASRKAFAPLDRPVAEEFA